MLLWLFTEGMLTLRAKPPTEAEVIDSLQKLKLALNLLVRYQRWLIIVVISYVSVLQPLTAWVCDCAPCRPN